MACCFCGPDNSENTIISRLIEPFAFQCLIEHEDRAEQSPVELVEDTAALPIPVADVPVPLLFDADKAA